MAAGPSATRLEANSMAVLGPVTDAHRIDEAQLARWLADQGLPGAERGLRVMQFQGGQSNPTFHLEAGDDAYVLRKKPPGALLPSAHMVEREYKVMAALAATDVPVPVMRLLCEDTAVIGTAFYVMDYLEGRIPGEPSLDEGFDPDERAAIWDSMNDALAKLHKVDPAAVGLDGFGKPANYVGRQLDRWTKQFEASKTDPMPDMDALIDWLASHEPPPDEVSIVHGDFRLPNLMLHPTEPRVIAILDWELSTLGHPLSDLAYNCMPYRMPYDEKALKGMVGLDLEALHRRLLPPYRTRWYPESAVLPGVLVLPAGRDLPGRLRPRAGRQRQFTGRAGGWGQGTETGADWLGDCVRLTTSDNR
jgi:aminoglycoside phosphotransferase (APT) family kinase protein